LLKREGSQLIFEAIKKTNANGDEFWSSRDLAKVLEYAEYRNFQPVIAKAVDACRNSSEGVENHFVHSHEMVDIGSGAKRKLEDLQLSRYACYLVIQNADPSKEIVALGQTYFAVQTTDFGPYGIY
jgi:DNA-damage-inducible protein D